MRRDRADDFRQVLLGRSAEYAFRALAVLAADGGGAVLRTEDLASSTGIPPAYLAKVMRRLAEAGIVRAQKGHGGGFRLARSPRRIRFRHVLDVVGPPAEQKLCAFGWGRCNPRAPCPLHPAWSALRQALLGWAETTTLADVAAGDSFAAAQAARPMGGRRSARET
jgi:Rrf2 family protein